MVVTKQTLSNNTSLILRYARGLVDEGSRLRHTKAVGSSGHTSIESIDSLRGKDGIIIITMATEA